MKKFPLFRQKQLLHLRNFIKNALFLSFSTAVRSCPEIFFCFAGKFNKFFYKAKNLPASHLFQTGKQTDFFFILLQYSAARLLS